MTHVQVTVAKKLGSRRFRMALLLMVLAAGVAAHPADTDAQSPSGKLIVEWGGKTLKDGDVVKIELNGSTQITVRGTEAPAGGELRVSFGDFGGKIEFDGGRGGRPGQEDFQLRDNWATGHTLTVRGVKSGEALFWTSVSTIARSGSNYDYRSIPKFKILVLEAGQTVTSYVNVAAGAADEGDAVSFTVSVTPPSDNPVNLTYSTAHGTTDSNDFTAVSSGTLMIPANTKTGTISVPTTEDSTYELDETFTLTIALSGAHTDVMLQDATATGTIRNDDSQPTSQISIADGAATEGAPIAFAITVNPTSFAPITLTYSVTDGTTNSQDIAAGDRTGTITIPALTAAATLSIPTAADYKEEPNETFTVTLSDPSQYTNLQRGTATGTINNDDTTIEVSVADATATEGSVMNFVVTLNPAPPAPLMLGYVTHPGTAGETDYIKRGERSPRVWYLIPVRAGTTTVNFPVQINRDSLDESDETFEIEIAELSLDSQPSARVVGGSRATGTIMESPIIISKTSMSLWENPTDSDTYTVRLRRQPANTATVTITETNNAYADVTLDKTSLEFTTSNWNQPQTVTVTGVDDQGNSSGSNVTLSHSMTVAGDTNTVRGPDLTVTLTDTDLYYIRFYALSSQSHADQSRNLSFNEGQTHTIYVRLSRRPPREITIRPETFSGQGEAMQARWTTDPAWITFTPQNWQTAQALNVTANRDSDTRNDRGNMFSRTQGITYQTPAGPSQFWHHVDDGITMSDVSIEDTATVEGSSLTFRIAISPAARQDFQLSVRTKQGTATHTDYTQVGSESTFPAGAQLVTIKAGATDHYFEVATTSDSVNETTGETLELEIAAQSGDSARITVTDSTATGTIHDSASQSTTPLVSISDATAREGSDLSFTITVSPAPTANLVVRATVRPGTATQVSDYTERHETITFASGETSRTFSVSTKSDTTAEVDETLTVVLTKISGTGSFLDRVGTGTIEDYSPLGLVLSKTSFEVDERSGSSESYTVQLNRQPTATVTVTLSKQYIRPEANGDVTIDVTTLTFTTSDWNQPQTVTVNGVPDENLVDQIVRIRHSIAVAGESDTTEGPYVTVDVEDVGAQYIRYHVEVEPGKYRHVTRLDFTEGETKEVWVTLNWAPSVTLNMRPFVFGDKRESSSGPRLSYEPEWLEFTGENWAQHRKIEITAEMDPDLDDQVLDMTSLVQGMPLHLPILIGPTQRFYIDDNGGPAMLTIDDADHVIPYTSGSSTTYNLKLPSQPSADVTVTISQSDNRYLTISPSTLTFTTSNWDLSQPVTVTTKLGQNIDNRRHGVKIHHSVVEGTAAAQNGPNVNVRLQGYERWPAETNPADLPGTLILDEGTTQTFKLRLTRKPDFDLIIEPGVSANGYFTVYPKSLTFTPDNWNVYQEITVGAVQDLNTGTELSYLYFPITNLPKKHGLPTPSVLLVRHNLQSREDYASRLEVHPEDLTNGRIVLTEGADPIDVRIRSTVDPGRTTEVDRYANPKIISIGATWTMTSGASGNWNDWHVVKLQAAVDDDNFDEFENFDGWTDDGSSDPAINYYPFLRWRFPVTIIDGSTAGVVVRPQSLTLTEGEAGKYLVRLGTDPGNGTPVTVTIIHNGDSDAVTVSPTSLTFTGGSSGTWKEHAAVTVTALDDADVSTENITITHTVSGYPNVTSAPSVSVVISEALSDGTNITIDTMPQSLVISNDGVVADTVYVRLKSDPGNGVTVTVTPVVPTVNKGGNQFSAASVTFNKASLTFTGGSSGNWNTRQSITVSRGSATFTGVMTFAFKANTNPAGWSDDITVTPQD